MVFFCALVVLACTVGISDGNEGIISAEELVDKIITSEKEIHDVRAEYVFFEPETNRPLWYAEWGYQGGQEFIAGIRFRQAEDNQRYKSSCRQKHSLDGKGTYYFFREEVESQRTGGSVKCLSIGVSDTFRANMTPNSLLGFDVTCGIRRTFGQALKAAGKVTLRKEPDSVDGHQCLVLEATGIVDAEFTWDVRAWIDSGRDFRPLKVEIFYSKGGDDRFKKIFRRIYDIKLRKIGGTWFPIEGNRDTFTTKWGYVQVLSVPSRKVKVDVGSVRINEGIRPEEFKVEFPPGCQVWDEFRKKRYTVGSVEDTAEDISSPVRIELSKLKRFAPVGLMRMIYPDTLVGSELPELAELQIKLDPDEVKGKMILVCFWDMNQRPSRHCIRELAKRAEKLEERGVAVVCMQASKIDKSQLDGWVKKYNIPFSVGMIEADEEKNRLAWGVKSLPWLILTDRQHVVRAEGFALNELDEKLKQ